MGSARVLLSIALLLVLLVAGALWLAGGDAPPGGEAASARTADAREGESRAPAALASAEVAEPAGDAAERRAVEAEPGAPRIDRGAGGTELAIRVAPPPGAPADPSLAAVLVLGRRDGASHELAAALLETSLLAPDVPRRAARAELEGVHFVRAPVEAGRAALRLPADAARGRLFLDGRFLFLDAPVAVEHAAEPLAIELAPELGACIRASIVLPPGVEARGVDAESFRGIAALGGYRPDGPRGGVGERHLELEGASPFELRGLPADAVWFLGLSSERLADGRHLGVRLEPGAVVERRFELRLGGVVSGRVVDPAGRPVEGASILRSHRAPWSREAVGATTDAEGGFVLAGIPAGELALSARAEDWLDSDEASLELEDGTRIEGLELALREGAAIAGTVTWPGGGAAIGAEVSATLADEGRGSRGAGRRREDVTDGEGRFELRGLPEGAYAVRALAEPQSSPELVEPWTGTPLRWAAQARDVPAGTRDLALELVAPAGVAGRVLDDLGRPVTAFEALATPISGAGASGAVARDFASEDGRFRLDGLHAGAWRISVEAEGHVPRGEAPQVEVPADERELAFVLARAATVRGRVVDPHGRPVAGATVSADAGADATFAWWEWSEHTAATDAGGAFELADLEEGALLFVASANGWAASEEVAHDLAPGSLVEDLLLPLRLGGRIVGELHDEDGEPVAGRSITYGRAAFGLGFGDEGATTDAAGRFAFERVTPGEYQVTAQPDPSAIEEAMREGGGPAAVVSLASETVSAPVVVRDGEESFVRLGAEPRAPVRLHGRVTEGGRPLARERLWIVAEGGSIAEGLAFAETGSDGRYETTLDRPGAYLVTLGAEGDRVDVRIPVDVPDTDELELDVEVPAGGISGRVYGPDGEPLGAVAVSVTREDPPATLPAVGDGPGRRWTEDDGSYAFAGLEAGRYSVRAGGSSRPPRSSADGLGVEVASGLRLGEGDRVDGVDLHLRAGGTLAGVVRDPAGDPVAGASVFVRGERGSLLAPAFSARTDAGGRFRASELPAGSVTVIARSSDASSVESAPVRIRAGEETSVEITVAPAAVLVVRVLDDGDEPLRASVRVLDGAGRDVGSMRSLDAIMRLVNLEGFSTREQRFGPLPEGSYRVVARAAGGREASRPVAIRGRDEHRVELRLGD